MRIIAGQLKNRNFESPHSPRTHPMSERIRGALFNTLGDIEGLTVLDAFAGSGAESFEAISRGASSVVAIEIEKSAQRAIKQSIANLQLSDRIKLIQAGCSSWSDNNAAALFDLVIIDPPFDDLQLSTITKLTRHVRRPAGLLVLNWPGKLSLPELEGFAIVEHKTYGDAQLAFYR